MASKAKNTYRIEATIPNVQYGNIRPTFESSSDDVEEVTDQGMAFVKQLWDKYGEKPLPVNDVDESGSAVSLYKEVKTFTGETIFYDEVSHKYKDKDGNQLVSASKYKKQFETPFPLEIVSAATAKKLGISVDVIQKMWSNNGRISREFGNAVHYAMEQYWLHKGYDTGEKNYHLPKHPILRFIVESFPERDAKVKPEVFVSSVKDGTVGQIDAVSLVDKEKKIVDLWDYKTDAELVKDGKVDKPKLKIHFIQMSFYAKILTTFGWTVRNLKVYNYTGNEWALHEQEPFNLTELEQELEDKKNKKK